MNEELDQLTIQPTIVVTLPDDKVIVTKKYLSDLEQKASYSGWWTLNQVADKYNRRPTWIVDNILLIPRFKQILEDKIVMYRGEGTRGYLFRPLEFTKFMDDYFSDICKVVRKQAR